MVIFKGYCRCRRPHVAVAVADAVVDVVFVVSAVAAAVAVVFAVAVVAAVAVVIAVALVVAAAEPEDASLNWKMEAGTGS